MEASFVLVTLESSVLVNWKHLCVKVLAPKSVLIAFGK